MTVYQCPECGKKMVTAFPAVGRRHKCKGKWREWVEVKEQNDE